MKTIFSYMILLLVLIAGSSNIRAQVAGMRKFTQLDGYTATKGYVIRQDKKGYIWLGTDNGGMSFDGKAFKVAQDVSYSPDAEIIRCLPLGNDRILMLSLSEHINYIDKGLFITAAEDTNLQQIKMKQCISHFDPVTGAHWLSNDSKMGIMYRFQGKTIQKYHFPENNIFIGSIINNKIICYKQIGRGYNYNQFIYDIDSRSYHSLYDENGRKKEMNHETIINCGDSPDYVTTFNPLTHLIRVYGYRSGDSVLRWIKNIIPPHQKISTPPELLIDHHHCLWMKPRGNYKGLLYYSNLKDKGEAPYHFEEPTFINSMFIDRNNNLWISSADNALYFLSDKHLKNLLLTQHAPLKKSVPHAVSGDGKGGICISYTNSRTLTCIRGNHFKNITLNNLFWDGSREIVPLDSNRFVIFGGDLALVDLSKPAVKYFDLNMPLLVSKDVYPYGDEGLLIATMRDVWYASAHIGKKQKPKMLFNQRTNTVAALANKSILMGTPDGLYIMPTLKTPPAKVSDPVLSRINITDILPLPDGGALIGTNSQGIFIVNNTGNKATAINISKQNGAKHIRRLYQQDDHTYWIATDAGAYAITFDHHWSVSAVKNYSFYDGLPSNHITGIYVCRDTGYFATTQGLGIIPLKSNANLQMTPPAVYINSVQAGDTVFHEPSGNISLPHYQHNMLLSLSAISYESLGNIHYYYQLSPVQDNWVETTNPEVRFSGLSPGTYTFRVYATNAKGIKNPRPITLIINIRPAFWQTTYFKTGLVIVTIVLLFLLMRWRIQNMEKKKYEALQQKKRLAELELEAIKAQINPHFIYNCLNSIKYLNYQSEYKQTQEYLSIFARLIRMTMQYSRKTFITIEEETDYLSNYLRLEKLRFKERLSYTISMEEGIDKTMLLPAMLLQPYVENTLKHGIAGKKEGGQLSIDFRRKNDALVIMISDNGPGFSSLKTVDTLGLHLAGTRALSYNELFNLDIRVEYYNQQDRTPGQAGAIVKITIHTTDYESTILQSSYYRR